MTGSSECVALFISCILAGFLAGFLFDVCRALRIGFRLKKTVPFIDVLFWAGTVIICYKIIFEVGEGRLRGFCFLGIAGGVSVYLLSFSKTLGKWMVISAKNLKRIIMWFICPVNIVLKTVGADFGGIVQNLQKNVGIFVKKTLEKN